MKRFLLSSLCIALSAYAFNAYAQDASNAAVMERMDRIERDVMMVQKQVARGGGSVSSGGGEIGNAAQLEVRLTAIEDEVRNLRGRVEENEFQLRKLSENLDKLIRDVDYRFNELPQGKPATTPAPTAVESKAAPVPKPAESKEEKTTPKEAHPAPKEVEPANDGQTSAGDGVLKLPKQGKPIDNDKISTPRDLYNHAFRLLNETKYDESASAFALFTQKYPKDPLVGNAYYWQGETYYIRRDYVNAADNFRQGFEALPDGPKASDNLLKLAMSLDALDRTKEACIVLQQIVTKFKRSSTSVTDKALQEQKRIGCK